MEDQEEYKFVCEKCNFKCNTACAWKIHTETEKHKTGKKKVRSDFGGPYICEKCKYKTKNSVAFTQHRLNEHATKEEREKDFKFYCKTCDYGTFSKTFYDNHNESAKHKKRIENYV